VSSTSGPLAGLRVIELAHIMAGPVCGLMLADMGADVIKVEKVPGGDDSRRMVPPEINGESSAFMMMNRNKRSIAVDLKQKSGVEVVKRLLTGADVVIENYRQGTMERFGLGYETLREINPGLIYCELSGYGRTGPYSDKGGFDLIAQGMSGLMSITGEGVGRPPVKVGAPVTDITAGILGAMGVLAAYTSRLKTGVGQKVDTSLYEAGIIHTYWQSAICFATGRSPGPMGSAHPLNAPYQAYPTADGWITIGAANQGNWTRLLDVLERPDIGLDARFADNAGRMANLPELEHVLSQIFRQRKSSDWLIRLDQAGVPAGQVRSVGEMHADQQTQAREMVVETQHPIAGTVTTIGTPVKFSATPGGVKAPAPLYGQHTRVVLQILGYKEAEIAKMASDESIVLGVSTASESAPC